MTDQPLAMKKSKICWDTTRVAIFGQNLTLSLAISFLLNGRMAR